MDRSNLFNLEKHFWTWGARPYFLISAKIRLSISSGRKNLSRNLVSFGRRSMRRFQIPEFEQRLQLAQRLRLNLRRIFEQALELHR
jgi:hypothetical protein